MITIKINVKFFIKLIGLIGLLVTFLVLFVPFLMAFFIVELNAAIEFLALLLIFSIMLLA